MNPRDVRPATDAAGSRCGTGAGASGSPDPLPKRITLEQRLGRIRHKIVVLSGKGGVGKSTVAAHLALSLARAGKRTGLLDVDIHGPSIPKMLRLDDARAGVRDGAILPVETAGLRVMSIAFLLQGDHDAVIWRGPMKMKVIQQFLEDVDWGELDYLVIDSPPGTGDEPLSVCQLVRSPDGAIVVTTPQDVATADVRRSIGFCRQLGLPVLGVVENMSGFVCPKCGAVTDIFKAGGGERMANEMGVPFLGRIPIDPAVGEACDAGTPLAREALRGETASALDRIVAQVLALTGGADPLSGKAEQKTTSGEVMKIAIPVAEGKMCMHFGHCEQFAVLEVDDKAGKITEKRMLTPPPHEPGVLPRWLHEQGVNVIIAGGMGGRAQALFAQNGIEVRVGAPAEKPEDLAASYLAGTLRTGDNACDH